VAGQPPPAHDNSTHETVPNNSGADRPHNEGNHVTKMIDTSGTPPRRPDPRHAVLGLDPIRLQCTVGPKLPPRDFDHEPVGSLVNLEAFG
jgi:hypothetical protein